MINNLEQKKNYFNKYWETRDIPTADARSRERAEIISDLIGLPDNKSILDAGCGRGVVMKQLKRMGYNVSGCDVSSSTVGELAGEGHDAFICDLENEPLPQKYDTVMCLEVLQQVFDPVKVLINMKTAVHGDGDMIASVPNEYHLYARLKLLLGCSHLGHFDESHIRLFTPGRARRLFKGCRLEIIEQVNIPVVPPRFGLLHTMCAILADLIPSLFSLSQIYKLKIK